LDSTPASRSHPFAQSVLLKSGVRKEEWEKAGKETLRTVGLSAHWRKTFATVGTYTITETFAMVLKE